jgi:uroporphyrinogen III methyltransferase/synthase
VTRILVTRPRAQAPELVTLLSEHGIEAISVPTVEIEAAPAEPLDRALAALGEGDWLVVTSPNGAEVVGRRVASGSARLHPSVRIAAVGPATAARLARYGLHASHVPERFLTEAIADGIDNVAGRTVLLARTDAATPALRQALERRAAGVVEVLAYRTILAPESSRTPMAAAVRDGVDGIAFTSGSTVRGLVDLLAPVELGRARALPSFCIGPVTAETARSCGLRVVAVAEEHTARGLAAAIATHFEKEAP